MNSFVVKTFLALIASSAQGALAQNYPVRAIRLVVPSSAGSSADVNARLIAPGLTQTLGQNVIVDDRDGAGGNIGAEIASKRPRTVEQVPRALARGCDPVAGCKRRT